MKSLVPFVLLLSGLAAACGSSGHSGFADGDAAAGGDGSTSPDNDAGLLGGGDAAVLCHSSTPDLAGCDCPTIGATAPCYPANADPATRNVGACKSGTQTCTKQGEFNHWGACIGAVTPQPESCSGTVDSNCNGKVGCADPACATDPTCNTACTNGQTRSCYTGPAGTENVGLCKDGTQTCANNAWPSGCPGEVLPAPKETCSDALDHNCNHLPGCLDFFSCLTDPACQGTCTQSQLDPGCVCPQGTGDTATCPEGMLGRNKGGSITNPGMTECCPCTTNDCGNAGCCGETVCAGNSQCVGLTCKPLPPSCNGQVNADCDDFPEDCDEPCCKCTSCP